VIKNTTVSGPSRRGVSTKRLTARSYNRVKDYKAIWDNLSTNFTDASFYVCCIDDEAQIRTNGVQTAGFLQEVLQITPTDRVLEIGCGVGRIGRELAPYCGEWHGADISGNMIAHAGARTAGLANVFLHELPGNSLNIFPDDSFDCVYSSIVFMHIDKIDMFVYISEALRVLKPGGRAYFDTYNLLAPEAWDEFMKNVRAFPYGYRPAHMSQFSTPQEMQKFMEEAGFTDITVDAVNPQLVVGVAHKPEAGSGWVAPPRLVDPALLALLELMETQQPVVSAEEAYEYVRFLEAEITRKNAALADLSARLKRRERELNVARQPRLPWKRRKGQH
jgi:ubiquinone/menaquinone biosynthesis C-methylase UbiE